MSGQFGSASGDRRMPIVPAWIFTSKCDNCEGVEERVFTDSWTGKELCLSCLAPIAMQVTMSPASEGDNLLTLLDGEWECGRCGADNEYDDGKQLPCRDCGYRVGDDIGTPGDQP